MLSGLVGRDAERVRQRVGAEQVVGLRVAPCARCRVAPAPWRRTATLLDVRRLGLDACRCDARRCRPALASGLEVDVGDHLAADLVGRAGGRLHDRDEDAEHEHRDEHGGHRGEATGRVALERAQRLAQEEAEPHPSRSRMRTANSRVDSRRRVGAGLLVADDAAVGELDHAAAHLVDHRHVVGGDHDRRAGAVDAVEQLHDPDRGLGIEVAGRLVGQQQRRVVDERARDRDALLLAAGELVGVVVQLRARARSGAGCPAPSRGSRAACRR